MDLIHSQKRALVFLFLVLFLFVENESFSLTVQQNSGQGKEDTSGNIQAKQSNDEIEKMLLKRMKEDQGKMELAKKSQLQDNQSKGELTGKSSDSFSSLSVSLPSTAEYNALMDFYQATNGANWTNNSGWSSANPSVVQDVSGFAGIATNASGNVTGIFLPVNNIVGELPESFGDLIYLEQVYLFSNNLYQKIPQSIGNLINLKGLYLNSSRLNWHTIPSTIGNLVNLEYLHLHSNYLQGTIPASLGNLTNLRELYLLNTKLTGDIPSQLGNLSQLAFLRLENALLEGPIPSSFSNLTQMVDFRLHNNQLTGPVPGYLCNFPNLTTVTLFDNFLTGTLPSCLYSKNLAYLQVANNSFSAESVIEMASYFSNSSDYLPQNQSTDTLYIQVKAGTAVALSTELGKNTPQASSYRWNKEGVPLFMDFSLSAYDYQDTTQLCQLNGVGINNCNAIYFVEITNPALPTGTVLKGPPTVVKTIPMFDITICGLLDASPEFKTINDLEIFGKMEKLPLITCEVIAFYNKSMVFNSFYFPDIFHSSYKEFLYSKFSPRIIYSEEEVIWSG